MATMISEVYDAFVSAGTPDDKARKAAEAMATYEKDTAGIRMELPVLNWVLALVLAITVPVLTKTLLHA